MEAKLVKPSSKEGGLGAHDSEIVTCGRDIGHMAEINVERNHTLFDCQLECCVQHS